MVDILSMLHRRECRHFRISAQLQYTAIQEFIDLFTGEKLTSLAFADWLCLRVRVWV